MKLQNLLGAMALAAAALMPVSEARAQERETQRYLQGVECFTNVCVYTYANVTRTRDAEGRWKYSEIYFTQEIKMNPNPTTTQRA